MARRVRVSMHIECLESRSLLSGIVYSLTTDHPVYQVGQPIQLTFTETNTGNQPVLVGVRPTDFTVVNGTGAIWQSSPDAPDQPATTKELQPGQSITQTATWDGTTPYTPPSNNGNAPTYAINQFGTFLVSNLNAPDDTRATFQITDPVVIQLTTDQSVYQMGDLVKVTYTESNTSDQGLTLMPDGTASALTFWHNGQDITPGAYPPVLSPNPTTLAAGQSITWSQTWNGIPLTGTYAPPDLTGTFFAAFGPVGNPTEYTAGFQISAPDSANIVSSVTTDQALYLAGAPVHLSFTETNEGSAPALVLVGHKDFEVAQGGHIVWMSAGAGTNLSWVLLPPGQSITETDTWNQLTTSGQLTRGGPFVITNLLDPNGLTASIFIPINDPTTTGKGTSNNDSTASDPTSQGSGTTANPPNESTSATPGATTPQVDSTVSTDRRAYKIGQSVRITMRIEGTSGAQAALRTARGREHITITRGSKVIWKGSHRVRTAHSKTFAPGQTLTLTRVWNGQSNQPGVHGVKPGAYTIDVVYGAFRGSTVIAIGSAGPTRG